MIEYEENNEEISTVMNNVRNTRVERNYFPSTPTLDKLLDEEIRILNEEVERKRVEEVESQRLYDMEEARKWEEDKVLYERNIQEPMKQSLNDIPYFSCIFARSVHCHGIGYKNSLPWKLKEDMDLFKKITTENSEGKENILIMGRLTWESMNCKPLPGRKTIVVSTSIKSTDEVVTADSLTNALIKAKSYGKGRYIFVIGGVSLLDEAFRHPKLESIYETGVNHYGGIKYDTYFRNDIPNDFDIMSFSTIDKPEYNLEFTMYFRRNNSCEHQYIELVEEILNEGEERGDRTGTGTLSIFGPQIKFDLRTGFPLLTTKTVGLRVVFEELIWMLRGQTNNKTLVDKKVNIWTKNSDDHYKKMIKMNPDYPEGEMGPLYGYQWRSFGGKYTPNKLNNINRRQIGVDGGFDQIADVIHQIRTNPESRRILFTGWNPQYNDEMCLPTCHNMCQFYISNKTHLNCKLTMRSNDIFLGAPFNIAQYALLTHMIAAMTGYTPGELVYSLGDAHIYMNHVEQMKAQIIRPVRKLPDLEIVNIPVKIEDFEFKDFILSGYDPHPSIKGDMAV